MRILLISDIHSNLVALEKVLSEAPPHEQVWCLGDLVGYGPHPNEVVEKLVALEAVCLAGNHDWAVLDKLDLDDFNPAAREAALWTRAQLKPANRLYLESLPDHIMVVEKEYTLAHGSPRFPIWEYILNARVASDNFTAFQTQVCFVGHTHVPIVYRLEDKRSVRAEPFPSDRPLELGTERWIVNPGSVGQPRDGDPRAAYAVLDTELRRVYHYRLAYDIAATQAAMRQAGLPARLVTRLEYGM